jgi:hypothetical protein
MKSRLQKGALRYPDFICIGAQKAGTTWLYRNLGYHPQIWLPPIKELHYFDVLHDQEAGQEPGAMSSNLQEAALRRIKKTMQGDLPPQERLQRIALLSLIGTRRLTDEWYGSIFAAAPSGTSCGEITPSYALLPDAGVRHLAKLNPDVRIIFILRDPIDRAWSEFRMTMQRKNSTKLDELKPFAKGAKFLARADYIASVERFTRHLSKEHLLIAYFDEVASSPSDLLRTVCTFLQIDYDQHRFKRMEEPRHKSPSIPMPAKLLEEARMRLAPVYRRLRALNNPIVDSWYQRHYG